MYPPVHAQLDVAGLHAPWAPQFTLAHGSASAASQPRVTQEAQQSRGAGTLRTKLARNAAPPARAHAAASDAAPVGAASDALARVYATVLNELASLTSWRAAEPSHIPKVHIEPPHPSVQLHAPFAHVPWLWQSIP